MVTKELFREQLEINAPFSEGALMVDKQYHLGGKAKVGDVPLFAFLANETDENVVMVMIKEDRLDKYEIVDGSAKPPVLKVKNK